MKKTIPFLIAGLAIGAFAGIGLRPFLSPSPEPEFHEHAEFALFLNDKRFDLSKSKFMNIEPCETDEVSLIERARAHVGEEGLKGTADLHNNVGHIIHAHKKGVTYQNFFNSLDMEFEEGRFTDPNGKKYKSDAKNVFRYFLNGQEVKNLPTTEIRDLDQAIATFGPRGRTQTVINAELAQFTGEACIYSNKCPHRGTAPAELCGE